MPTHSSFRQLAKLVKERPYISTLRITVWSGVFGTNPPPERVEKMRAIAEMRAEAIKAILVREGVDASRIQTEARTEPLAKGKPKRGGYRVEVGFSVR